jgi:hypothetical protein
VNISWDEGYLTATVAAKGKVKVSGMIGGKKASATSQLLLGETDHVIPVLVTAKPNSFALLLTLAADGSVSVTGLDGCKAGKVLGLPASGATFQMDTGAEIWGKLPGTVLADQLPDGLQVDAPGGKWSVPKAGKVVYVKGTTDVDPAKAGQNPSGLKLSYKAKDGSFKGSFKAYADNGGKLKATTVDVSGVLVGNVGSGLAIVKKTGSVSVTVSK